MANYSEFFRGRNTLLSQKEQLLAQLEQAKQEKAQKISAVELQLKQRQIELNDVENLEKGVAAQIEKIDAEVAQVESIMLQEQRDAIARLKKGREDLESFAVKFNAAASAFGTVIQELAALERQFRDDSVIVDERQFLLLAGYRSVGEALDHLPVLAKSETNPQDWVLQQLQGAQSRGIHVLGYETQKK